MVDLSEHFKPDNKPDKTPPKAKKKIRKVSEKKQKAIDEGSLIKKGVTFITAEEFQKISKQVKVRKRKELKDKGVKRLSPLFKIKKDFDVIYSLVVKMEPATDEGIITCYCGKRLHWTNANNSHFIPRSTAPSLIHDRMNTHPSCIPCNGFKEGNRPAYIPWMNKKYGEAQVALLEQRGQKKSNNGVFEYLVMIDEYIMLFLNECERLNYEPSKTQLSIINKYIKHL